MAIKVNFYRFTKKENSTARPSGTGTELDCTLKDSSSIFFPVIKLNLGALSAPSFNYCIIPNFNRWYYITNWEWDRGLWYASLQVDVLATYKPEIGNSSLYALRASNSWDGSIPDNLYPAKVGTVLQEGTAYNAYGPAVLGTFILGVVSKSPTYGAIKYYALDSGNMRAVINALLDDTLITDAANGFNLTDASIGLQKSLVDPVQYIKSCICLPFDITSIPQGISSNAQAVTVFNWTLNAQARTVTSIPYFTITHDFTIPKHPQTSTRGNFVNQAPWTTLTLNIPPLGVIELDTTVFAASSTVTVELQIDLPTGLGIVTIKNGNYVVNRLETQIGIPVQLSQITRDYMGAVTSTVTGIAGTVGAAMAGNVGGAIASAASGIDSAIRSMIPRSQTIGSGGSYAQISDDWNIYAQFFGIADDDISHNGRPLCQMVTPSSGYYLIQDGDVPIDGTKEEAAELKRYLEGGFYYE